MPIDTKHDDLQSLRIDRSGGGGGSEPQPAGWARRYIVAGIAVVAVLSLSALAYRLLSSGGAEVEVARAAAVEDVALLVRTIGPAVGVKASGGIRDAATARALIAAGARRLGTSSGLVIVGHGQPQSCRKPTIPS